MARRRKGPDDQDLRGRFTRRALVLGGAQLGLIGLLGSRLHDMQVVYAKRYAVMADRNRMNVQWKAPQRGEIRDRFGILLAETVSERNLVLVPDLAGNVRNMLERLQRIVDLGEVDIDEIADTAARQNRLVPIIVKRDLTWAELARVSLLAPELPGIDTELDGRRVYHFGQETGHVVGYVGRPSAEAIEADAALRLPTLRVGKTGVELGEDEALRGTTGTVRREVDARGRFVRELETEAAVAGRDLVLSIDTELQARILRRMTAESEPAAVVAMHVRTGEIMAMCSTPTYDTQLLAGPISRADWRALVEQPGDPMQNRCVRGQYPPGSTFKMVTALAALKAGAITRKTEFTCTGSVEIAGHTFNCWKSGGHGRMRLNEALKNSCDVYFYEAARAAGISNVAEMARLLGLGATTDCGIGGEKPGLVPDPEWKAGAIGQRWYDGETLLSGIGQGYLLATPLQLALMTARIASGLDVSARLIRPDDPAGVATAPALALEPEWLDLVRRGMYAVVNEGGTGSVAELPFGAIKLAGKTGTAQVSRASRGRSSDELARGQRDHSLFVCYAPFDEPRYAIAAVVEHGGGGSKAAAPLARDAMVEVLKRDPSARPPFVPRRQAGLGEGTESGRT
ncbi:MAG: penicillin-binding protein 2 [Hyphomicrobiaceae bacterium]